MSGRDYPRVPVASKSAAAHASHIPADAIAAARESCERYQGGVRAGGGIPAVAAKLGMSPAVLYNKLSGDEESYHRLSVADFEERGEEFRRLVQNLTG